MYITRDKDGQVCLFNFKPERLDDIFTVSDEIHCNNTFVDLPNSELFNDITWEDEPREVFIVEASNSDVMLNDAIEYYERKINPSNEEIMLNTWLHELRVLRMLKSKSDSSTQ